MECIGSSQCNIWIADRKPSGVMPDIFDFVTGCYGFNDARKYLKDSANDVTGNYRIFNWKTLKWYNKRGLEIK